MSTFYGTIKGTRGEATRCGSKASGIKTVAASWKGAVETTLQENEDGATVAEVWLIPWHGEGVRHLIYRGPVNDPAAAFACP